MEWLALILVLGSLIGVMPAVIDQYRRDRAGFWKTLRLFGVYLLYIFANIGVLLWLLSGPQTAATAAAALALVAPQVMAADTDKMENTGADTNKMDSTGAAGTPAGQPAGAETSDRTPDKATPTPDTQVDKTKEGETSDRTPEKK